ncbi:MAG: glucosaminidase domain-containing protein [Bacteroidetes bacterium]|nr:glucosaminidase domain-containing protein [Bacteroidota bacterium]
MKKIGIRYQRTFKQFFLIFIFFIMQFCGSPTARHDIKPANSIAPKDISTVREIPESHKAFLARFLPEIHTANNKILQQRNDILDLKDTMKDAGQASAEHLYKLNSFLKKYRIDAVATSPAPPLSDLLITINKLLKRADIIPLRLVMAQAIIESGWGNSGFARNDNNYFGVHCYTEGCGVRPAANDSADFYVKAYTSEMAGIEDYLWILNTGFAYRGLRETRAKLRNGNKPIDPFSLARGLSRYSAKGEEYVKMVSNIIRNYIPENADDLLTGKSD